MNNYHSTKSTTALTKRFTAPLMALLLTATAVQADSGLGVGVGVGIGGIGAGVGVGVGGSDGVNAGAGASVGGSDGVNAGAGASVGGSDGIGAGVSASVGGTGGSSGDGSGTNGGSSGDGAGGSTGNTGGGSGNGTDGTPTSTAAAVSSTGQNPNVINRIPVDLIVGSTVWTRDNELVGMIERASPSGNGQVDTVVRMNAGFGLASPTIRLRLKAPVQGNDRIRLGYTRDRLIRMFAG